MACIYILKALRGLQGFFQNADEHVRIEQQPNLHFTSQRFPYIGTTWTGCPGGLTLSGTTAFLHSFQSN